MGTPGNKIDAEPNIIEKGSSNEIAANSNFPTGPTGKKVDQA
jgi:hypothetical protein